MRAARTSRVVLTTVVPLVVVALRRLSWAQAPALPPAVPLPMPSDGSSATQAGVIVGLVLAGIVFAIVTARIVDLRRKRETEAVEIQSRVADALLADGVLGRLPVSVTVHIPIAHRDQAVAEVRGDVPSQEMREAVMQAVQREVLHLRPQAQVEDRLMVMPASRHAA